MNKISPLFALEAEQLINEGSPLDAIELVTAGISEYPHYLTAYIVLIKAFEKINDFSNALLISESAIKLFPENKILQSLRSQLLNKLEWISIDTDDNKISLNYKIGMLFNSDIKPGRIRANDLSLLPHDIYIKDFSSREFIKRDLTEIPEYYLNDKFEKINNFKYFHQLEDDVAFLTKNLNNINIEYEYEDESVDSENNSDDGSQIVTETMAEIYVMQGAMEAAIKAFETLAEQNPDRKEYFEEKISDLKAKII